MQGILMSMQLSSSGPTPPTVVLSRTEKFMARVVEHLATLTPAERSAWLRRQLGVWTRQYERWAEVIDGGKAEPISDVTREDYLATISALDRLLHRIEP
jgi:hypothetical protein